MDTGTRDDLRYVWQTSDRLKPGESLRVVLVRAGRAEIVLI